MKDLVNTWQDLPSDDSAVAVPVLAILSTAVAVISAVAVNQEDGEVEHVEVGDRCASQPSPHWVLD